MNLFGLQISLSNGKYVKKAECHQSMDGLHKRISEVDTNFNRRIDDLDSKLELAIHLIKSNGK